MTFTNILDNIIFNPDKPAISILFETTSTKEIRIVFKKGQEMQQHQTPYPISVELFEGQLDFEVAKKTYHLQKGALLALDGGVPHSLKAVTDCIVRLTLSKQDTLSRVEKVIKL